MHKSIKIDLAEADRQALSAIVTDCNSPQKHVWRAQIVLLTADGCGTMELTRRTGTSKTAVWRWQERFLAEGTEAGFRVGVLIGLRLLFCPTQPHRPTRWGQCPTGRVQLLH